MASLEDIGRRIPELLFDILEYLNPQDTFSLLLAGKDFYSVCHKQLWKDLRVYKVGVSNDEHPHESISPKILKSIDAYGVEGSGLGSTRSLRLHRESLRYQAPEFVESGLCSKLGLLLEGGELELDCVELSYFCSNMKSWQKRTKPQILLFLKLMGDYLLERGTKGFSLILTMTCDPGIIIDVPFPLQSVTDLRLEMDWTIGLFEPLNARSSRWVSGTQRVSVIRAGGEEQVLFSLPGLRNEDRGNDAVHPDDSDLTTQADQCVFNHEIITALIEMLLQTVNLKYLSIRTSKHQPDVEYKNLRLAPESTPVVLRDTIKNIPKLHTLEIIGRFFHPSYFITPPESVQRVVYDGFFSHEWFERFSRCSFPNVRDLRVSFTTINIEGLWCGPSVEQNKLVIKDVEVTGVRRCELIAVGRATVGLELAMIKRNKGLTEDSKRRLAGVFAKNVQRFDDEEVLRRGLEFMSPSPPSSVDEKCLGEKTSDSDDADWDEETRDMIRECLKSTPGVWEKVQRVRDESD
ncbi:hypothetical protein TWF481_008273 [Arthrobotrys musiformis]|uniref:F-box domain-containing protein n=1 Tax=Arthrobotrys musiformis TaxID=47236 RepID=A0AAV9W8R9_9PEZI